MIPQGSFANLYVKIMGTQGILTLAKHNLLQRIEQIPQHDPHAFFTYNAQTQNGIARNRGANRFYSWRDTLIDCRGKSALLKDDTLQEYEDMVQGHPRFCAFKAQMEEHMGNLIEIKPFYHILRDVDNMRYDVRSSSKKEGGDMVRFGIKLSAYDRPAFDEAMQYLKNWNNPFMRKRISMH